MEAGLDAVSGEADSVALEDSEDSDDESFEVRTTTDLLHWPDEN